MKPQLTRDDFRIDLYKKYVSTFKKFIGDEDTSNKKSDYEIFQRRYLPLLKDFPKTASILELGCGSGYMMQFLQENGFKNLYGIDISEQQAAKAAAKGLNVEVKNVFEFFETNNQKYDIVFALDFIEHFFKDELLNLFSNIENVMNYNGILIVHTPNGQGIFSQKNIYGDLTHLTIFNPNSLSQILRINNFHNINFYETGPVPKNITGLIRFILWKVVKLAVKCKFR